MLRSLTLTSLALTSLAWLGCSNNDNTVKPPVVVGDDMSDGTGGNGGGGGSGGGTGGADMTMVAGDMGPALPDLSGLPAPDHDPTQHPAAPRLNAGSGGVVNHNSTIPAPEIWTAVWDGDEQIGADVQKFTAWMLSSAYWTGGVAEYGVGAGTAKGVLSLGAKPASGKISQLELDQRVSSKMGVNPWPTANANTIISLVTDPSISVTDVLGNPAGCVTFDGYHSITQSGTSVPYLVNAYCNDASGKPDWNNLTVTISHEAVEASTDWNLSVNEAYYPGTKAKIAGGGETGDNCIAMNASINTGAGDTYLVQRIFSDAAAAAGNKPFCLDPVNPNSPFWGAGLYSGGTNDAAISIARTGGTGSATIKIEPFSYDTNFGAMSFYVVGSPGWLPTGVKLTPDIARRPDPANPGQVLGMRVYGLPGSTTTVTVTVDNTFPASSVGKVNPFLIIAQTPDRMNLSVWWGSLTVTK